jgi:fermentation-respiration switch protein FrsA (DUF1100 family)
MYVLFRPGWHSSWTCFEGAVAGAISVFQMPEIPASTDDRRRARGHQTVTLTLGLIRIDACPLLFLPGLLPSISVT